MGEVTNLLAAAGRGDSHAAEKLWALVYHEMRALAAHKLAAEGSVITLQPTALVHEVWLRLGRDTQQKFRDKGHFFSAAAEAMRRILIERARRRNRQKRGGAWTRVELADIDLAVDTPDDLLLDVDEAIHELAKINPIQAQLVELRYFIGLTMADAASALEISEATAKRYWSFARDWLYKRLRACPKSAFGPPAG